MRAHRIAFAAVMIAASLTSASPGSASSSTPLFAAAVDRSDFSEILVVGHLGGSGHTILKHDSYASILSLAISPSGQRIAFATGRNPDQQIAVIDVDGSNQTILTHTHGVDYQGIAWSPDERTIYYGRSRDGFDSVWAIPADGSKPGVALTDGGKATPASSRPGSNWLSLNSYRHIANSTRCGVMRADGSVRRTIGPHECMLPRWRPNKPQLAASLVTANGIEGHVTIQLWILSTASSHRHAVPHTQPASTYGSALPLAWSDDGQFIYYRHSVGNSDEFHVYRIRPDGSGKKDFTPDQLDTFSTESFAVQPAA